LIDQLRLPHELEIITCRRWPEVAAAITTMQIRGAPAIGVCAAYGVALAAQESQADTIAGLLADLEPAFAGLRATRPTAVNLFWALERMRRKAETAAATASSAELLRAVLLGEAEEMADEDVAVNQAIGRNGAALVPDKANILTHCNAGALATVDYGTALGVIRAAHEAGKQIHVYVDETRPYLQGARLTAWELQQLAIPHTLITDNMAGHFMRQGKVDLVVLGADRIAANGDFANKIGTYTLAVLAQHHGIPFYSAAPTSTIDLSLPSGEAIPIEERSPEEVVQIRGVRIAPAGVRAAHPAFDVTPWRYLSGIITERGVVRPPFDRGLQTLMETSDESAA